MTPSGRPVDAGMVTIARPLSGTPYPWEGSEWQHYCTALLYLHHGGLYQPIPDQDRGDGGLEGFSTDGRGCGYQCHAPKAHYGIAERRDQQVRKIKRTVQTLIANRDLLAKLIGDYVILEVRFLFPLCESRELVAEVRAQETKLRRAAAQHNIAWLGGSVVISAHQADELLASEIAALEQTAAAHARLPIVAVEEDEIDEHLRAAADELTAAAAKLRERFGEQAVPELLRVVLSDHLIGTELAAHLAGHNPQTHEDYERVVEERRTRIRRESLEGATATRTLTQLGDELSDAIIASVPGIHRDDARTLAQGVVAAWLIECPLQFGRVEVAA
jgi:hypothetical protein